ncbi:MAG: tetratricopeptide repeat protein [Deltaproteobacteria bacterium]|nr:tetratricopeptide repeat protein [Deltaproteobacteria bacterium]
MNAPRALRRDAGLVLVALATWLAASPAAAQSSPEERRAAARVLFQEGVALTAQNRWPEAEDRFRRALALERLAVVVYNLGVALERQGRLVEGSELLREAARDSGRAGESARQALVTVEPRIPRVELTVRGLGDRDVVWVDGSQRDRALLGVSVPIDPGPHRVEVRRGGHVVATQQIVVSEGARQTIVVDVPPDERAELRSDADAGRRRDTVLPRIGGPPIGRPLPDEDDEDDDEGSVLTSWWFWTAVGVVAAGAATTAIVLSAGGGDDPYRGNFMPRSLEVD